MIFIFFCKQKTAYEMRISDWSSDVCSSDLHTTGTGKMVMRQPITRADHVGSLLRPASIKKAREQYFTDKSISAAELKAVEDEAIRERSDERRVGKECVSTGRSR